MLYKLIINKPLLVYYCYNLYNALNLKPINGYLVDFNGGTHTDAVINCRDVHFSFV